MTGLSKIGALTNATKAQIITALNALLALGITFHVVLTAVQLGAIDVAANAVLSLVVGLTYTQSALRVAPQPPDAKVG